MNALLKLEQYGQSYWLDDLTRAMIASGELRHRVAVRGLRGVTSNPTIFHKAITESRDYDEQIEQLAREGCSALEIYETLTTRDVRDACDVLRPVYEQTEHLDGYVSLEVSPHLAHDAEGSISEAQRLYAAVDRRNVFIKIPGTTAGVTAIEELLYQGVPVNVTLLFSIERYATVAEAYMRALERRAAAGRSVGEPSSVASFFLSRIDVLVDELLSHRFTPGAQGSGDPRALLGKVAIANAKLAYNDFKILTSSERWRSLAERGANVQRLLWASTSTKNPAYSDVMYVEPLIGPATVNTMPEATIAAFENHGCADDTLEAGLAEAADVMRKLETHDIDFHIVAEQLLNEGVEKFIVPYDALLAELESRRRSFAPRAARERRA